MSRAPTTAAQRAKRLHLLDATEIAALYDRPQFTDEERAYYFALTPTEIAHMQTFIDGAVQAMFVLSIAARMYKLIAGGSSSLSVKQASGCMEHA
jgi:hypothetical protein